ncbi:MAG: hypothetical protein ACRCX2_06610 [Paraclostridium sp.]
MNTKIKEIEEQLPRNCCSFCKHLSLQGPDENFRYEIKCIMLDDTPIPGNACNCFDPEYTHLNNIDLDTMYINFLETALRIDYSDYLDSMHWQLFKEKALTYYGNKCCICNSEENLDVYHKIKNLGREDFNDVKVLCFDCNSKN